MSKRGLPDFGEIPRVKKADFRQRAHCNPLSDSLIVYPPSPDYVDWGVHFPKFFGKTDHFYSILVNTTEQPMDYNLPKDDSLNGKRGPHVEFVDIGCGFGGLLVALAPMFPRQMIFGVEIREKVATFVCHRIQSLRAEALQKRHSTPPPDTGTGKALEDHSNQTTTTAFTASTPPPATGISLAEPSDGSDSQLSVNSKHSDVPSQSIKPAHPNIPLSLSRQPSPSPPSKANNNAPSAFNSHDYSNISVIRSNVMKFFVNYFRRAQLSKLFFCYPDPQFKRSNFRRRIITPALLSTYAFTLRDGGLIYTVTDVWELHKWMTSCCEAHPLFERVDEDDLKDDVCFKAIQFETEEGKKVKRCKGNSYMAVFRRVPNPPDT